MAYCILLDILSNRFRAGYPSLPGDGQGKAILHNGADCSISVHISTTGQKANLDNFPLGPGDTWADNLDTGQYQLSVESEGTGCAGVTWADRQLLLTEDGLNILVSNTTGRLDGANIYNGI